MCQAERALVNGIAVIYDKSTRELVQPKYTTHLYPLEDDDDVDGWMTVPSSGGVEFLQIKNFHSSAHSSCSQLKNKAVKNKKWEIKIYPTYYATLRATDTGWSSPHRQETSCGL